MYKIKKKSLRNLHKFFLKQMSQSVILFVIPVKSSMF